MTIRLACPACGQRQTIAPGQDRFCCRNCHTALVLKRRHAVWQELTETAPPRRQQRQAISWLLAGGVTVGLLLAPGIVLAMALRDDKDPARPAQTVQKKPTHPAVPRGQMPDGQP